MLQVFHYVKPEKGNYLRLQKFNIQTPHPPMKFNVLLLVIFCFLSQKSFSQLELSQDEKTKKFGFTNDEGEWVIQPRYDAGEDFYDFDFTMVKQQGKWGMINRGGENVLPFQYDKILENSDWAYRSVTKEKKFGLINMQTGKELVPCKYDKEIFFEELYNFNSLTALVIKNKKAGLIDETGKERLACLFDLGNDPFVQLEGDYIRAKQNKKVGIVNTEGEIIVPFQYEDVDHNVDYYMDYDTTLFDVKRKKKWGVYSVKYKKEVIPVIYDDRISFEETGYAIVSRKKKFGIIDREGTEVIMCMYSQSEAYGALDKLIHKETN